MQQPISQCGDNRLLYLPVGQSQSLEPWEKWERHVPTLSDAETFIAEIDNLALAVNGCYGEMSPAAKAYALQLCHALSAVKREMIKNL